MSRTKTYCQTLVASGARTATGASYGEQVAADFDEVCIYTDVTAASGTTPTLQIVLQSSPDGVQWFTHSAGATLNSVSQELIKAENIGQYTRIAWVIGGTTPSFTFSVKATFKKRGF